VPARYEAKGTEKGDSYRGNVEKKNIRKESPKVVPEERAIERDSAWNKSVFGWYFCVGKG